MSDEETAQPRIRLTPPPLHQAGLEDVHGPSSALEAAVLTTALHDLVACVVSNCEFTADWGRRTTQGFGRALKAEAARWDRGTDWRGEYPPPVRLFVSGELRNRVAGLSRRRGPPPRYLARPAVEMALVGMHAVLTAAGRGDKAARILAPGQVPNAWDGPAAPTALSTAVGIVTVAAEVAGIDIPRRELQRAADNIRRDERRRRQKPCDG